jgi:predicted TPR repeat methyltransferase
MSEKAAQRAETARKAREFFDTLWQRGDHWGLDTSSYEQEKYKRQAQALQGKQYGRVLEIGCGTGAFTRMLAPMADYVLGLDVAPTAVERANTLGLPGVEFRVANIMDHDLEADQPWDLIVLGETIYYIGWLYSFFDVAWLAFQLYGATAPGGRLLMTNTHEGPSDFLLKNWIIRTYRDLLLNVGYKLVHEESVRGLKRDHPHQALLSLFEREKQP